MIKNLSIIEKCKLCGGEDFWHTHAVSEADIPAITMSDGPHGLRKQDDNADHLGIHDSIKAICFPSASCLAASFDRDAAYRMGRLLGLEARAEGVHLLLGPAINIKRTPLCGRNFECFSEDPFLTGEMAAWVVRGIQSAGVGACVKHYAANNQENGRMVISADMDERTLREIYLSAFERVVTQENPRAVMSSYNRVNGEYAGESKRLLTDILRGEWGFDGIVVSDWYAINDRVNALLAGLDLEMPGGATVSTDKLIAAASENGVVADALEVSAERIAKAAHDLCVEKGEEYDKNEHHEYAVELACESAVLLKNNNVVFPLNNSDKVLLIGEYALKPRYQGGGSSHINAYLVDDVAEYINGAEYCTVINVDNENERESLRDKIIGCDKIVLFTGLPDECESEGYDRNNLDLPSNDNALIEFAADCAAENGKSVGIVLFNGSPVAMPWINKVDGVLSMGLGGEGAGKACAKILTGAVNPSGRLAESYPLCIEHTPAYLNSKGMRRVDYAEGVFVGYRYYETKKIGTLFPFGHGLSYTIFEYTDINIDKTDLKIKVTVKVKNTGGVFGKESIQLYVAPPINGAVNRPSIELKGFEKISLGAGEEKTVKFSLKRRDFAYFDNAENAWIVERGEYRIVFGRSCADEILSASIVIDGDSIPPIIDDNTTVGELLNYEPTAGVIRESVKRYSSQPDSDAIGGEMKRAMLLNAPLRLVKGIAGLDDNSYELFKLKLKMLAGAGIK